MSITPQLTVTGSPTTGYRCSGRHLTGVTMIIGSVLRAPQLEEWFKRVGTRADAIRDEAAAYGSSIHAALAAHARGDKLMPLDLPEDWWASVLAGRKWIDDNLEEIYAVEEPVASLIYGYAGKPDLIGRRYGRKSPCIVDFKTSANIYTAHLAQLAGYRQAAKETYGLRAAERIIVRLSKDEPGVVRHDVLEKHTRDFALFGHILAIHNVITSGV